MWMAVSLPPSSGSLLLICYVKSPLCAAGCSNYTSVLYFLMSGLSCALSHSVSSVWLVWRMCILPHVLQSIRKLAGRWNIYLQ